ATDALDARISGDVQNAVYARISEIFAEATRLILQTKTAAGDIGTALEALRPGVKKQRGAIGSLGLAAQLQQQAAEFETAGVPTELSGEVARLSVLVLVPEMQLISGRTSTDPARVAQTYFAVTDTFRIDRLLSGGEQIVTADHYESLALT